MENQESNTAESYLSRFNHVVNHHRGRVYECLQAGVDAVVHAVRAECAARPVSPITQTRQLTERDVEDLIIYAKRYAHGPGSVSVIVETVAEYLIAEIPKRLSIPATPGYHKTAEKPPTEKDANAHSAVLGWGGGRWTDVHWNQEWRGEGPGCMATRYPFWMPQPPAPVSPVTAEDAAFNSHVEAQFGKVHFQANRDAVRMTWEAAKAFYTAGGTK